MSVPNPGQEPTPTPTPGASATPVVTQTTPEAPTAPTTPNTQTTLPDRMPDVDNDAAWKDLPPWVRNDIKALRTEAAGYRVKHNEAQAKLDEIERASLSEQERLKADVEKFQTKVIPEKDQQIRELQVQVLAGTKNVVDTDVVVALLDWEKVNSGTLSLSEALDALLEQKSFLKKPDATTSTSTTSTAATASTSSSTNPGTQNTSLPTFTQSQIAGMTPAEMTANSAAIKQAMADGRVDFTR